MCIILPFLSFIDNWILSVVCQRGPMVMSTQQFLRKCTWAYALWVFGFLAILCHLWWKLKRKERIHLSGGEDCAVRVIKNTYLSNHLQSSWGNGRPPWLEHVERWVQCTSIFGKKDKRPHHHLCTLQAIMLLWSCQNWWISSLPNLNSQKLKVNQWQRILLP